MNGLTGQCLQKGHNRSTIVDILSTLIASSDTMDRKGQKQKNWKRRAKHVQTLGHAPAPSDIFEFNREKSSRFSISDLQALALIVPN